MQRKLSLVTQLHLQLTDVNWLINNATGHKSNVSQAKCKFYIKPVLWSCSLGGRNGIWLVNTASEGFLVWYTATAWSLYSVQYYFTASSSLSPAPGCVSSVSSSSKSTFNVSLAKCNSKLYQCFDALVWAEEYHMACNNCSSLCDLEWGLSGLVYSNYDVMFMKFIQRIILFYRQFFIVDVTSFCIVIVLVIIVKVIFFCFGCIL